MLVLSREIGQRIRIGKDIWIEILDTSRRQVRIGIEAPKEIPIEREEIIGRFDENCNVQLVE